MADIRSDSCEPYCRLSNFYAHTFVLDGVVCASMEGFLQSLKVKNPKKQLAIVSLTGKTAKKVHRRKLSSFWWRLTGKLYWQGVAYVRTSDAYQCLLDRAYAALNENEGFRLALRATGNEPLCHSIGKTDMRKTVLTEYELISRLVRLRDENRIKEDQPL
ncbi:MAG: hypothetical protein IJW46_06200 [Clostridia bacterium]|nr:hypothetical protein [Clostridia bacterium]